MKTLSKVVMAVCLSVLLSSGFSEPAHAGWVKNAANKIGQAHVKAAVKITKGTVKATKAITKNSLTVGKKITQGTVKGTKAITRNSINVAKAHGAVARNVTRAVNREVRTPAPRTTSATRVNQRQARAIVG